LIGTQFSISLEGAELIDVVPGALALTDKNFTMANGELLVSFDKVDGVNVSKDEVLFAMELNNASAVSFSETLRPEVYVDGNGSVETMGIQIDVDSETTSSEFSVYQNTPNPFSEETTIAFELPSSSVVYLQIEFTVKQSELETTGILYYQISTDTHIATRKMIVLK